MSHLSDIRSLLQQMKPELQQRFHVQSLGLFGSVVREDFTSKSDIDILVDFSSPVGIEFIDLGNYMEEKLKRKVDLVSRGGIKDKYFKAIEGEIIYV